MSDLSLQFDRLEGFTRFEHAAMATSFVLHLRSNGLDAAQLRSAAGEATRLLDELESRLSFYRETSEVTRINRAAPGEVLRVSEATLICLLTALEVAAESEGVFDPFAGRSALVAKGQPVPSHLSDLSDDDEPDTPCLQIDPTTSTVQKLTGRRWLDLGAVGKGYALDAMANLLREWEVESGLLVAGGSSVVAFGPGPSTGGRWAVRVGRRGLTAELLLDAPCGLGASGEGFQPGHLVRRPGHAEAASPRRTYVIAPNGALADALSTALFVAPEATRKRLMEAWSDVAVWVEPSSTSTAPPAAPRESAQVSGVFTQLPAPPVPQVLLVIPAWKESRRLPRVLPRLCQLVTEKKLPISLLVVDDGSPEEERRATEELIDQWRRSTPALEPLASMRPHGGKGAAILHGWAGASAGVRWLGFVDADGAVPAEAAVYLIQQALRLPAADRVLAANRRHSDPQFPVRRPALRAAVGALIARWSRWRLHHGASDPQCGCKFVPASLLKSAQLQEKGYGLDLELLLLARDAGLPVENVPIAWQEIRGSHLRPRDLWRLLQTVERLRRRFGSRPTR